jgi:hypothetical protein
MSTDIEFDWTDFEEPLPRGWRELAIEMKLLKPNLPEHINAKVKGVGEVLRLLFYQSASDCSLKTAAASFAAPEPTASNDGWIRLTQRSS